jgi:hypothetical protein
MMIGLMIFGIWFVTPWLPGGSLVDASTIRAPGGLRRPPHQGRPGLVQGCKTIYHIHIRGSPRPARLEPVVEAATDQVGRSPDIVAEMPRELSPQAGRERRRLS